MAVTGRKSDKRWRDALILAATRTDAEGQTMLARIAKKCVEAAVEGDMQAVKEIGDRIDGKPVQQTEISGPDGEAIPIGMKVSFVDGSGNSGT